MALAWLQNLGWAASILIPGPSGLDDATLFSASMFDDSSLIGASLAELSACDRDRMTTMGFCMSSFLGTGAAIIASNAFQLAVRGGAVLNSELIGGGLVQSAAILDDVVSPGSSAEIMAAQAADLVFTRTVGASITGVLGVVPGSMGLQVRTTGGA